MRKTLRYKTVAVFRKMHWREILAVLFILGAVYFFYDQKDELNSIIPSLKKSDSTWITAGILVTLIYIFLQSLLYVCSFASVSGRISVGHATELFLKRNLISFFLPAGAISSLAYLPTNVKQGQANKHQVHQASAIYAFVGIFSVLLVAVPVCMFLVANNRDMYSILPLALAIGLILSLPVYVYSAIKSKKALYHLVIKIHPRVRYFVDEILTFNLSGFSFFKAICISVLIEIAGIVHLYIAMLAIGIDPLIEACIVGYIVATILLIISPVLRGLGAIEISLTFVLQQYGFTLQQALEITLLFRIFEFWLPIMAGAISFLARGKHLFLRLLPPVLLLMLGLVNVFSVLSPPITSRLKLLREYLPVASIQASNMLVILTGLTMIILANYLFKGFRNAWVLALSLSIVSCVANIFKALDYEEAIFAAVVIGVLLSTARQYRLKGNSKLVNIGIATGISATALVVVAGAIGFYFLDKKHFGIDFSWRQSISYAFQTFILIEDITLIPVTKFGGDFLLFIRVLGAASWAFFFYCLIKPVIHKRKEGNDDLDKAKFYLDQFGDSALDYFKISYDKLLFVSDEHNGFVSYRIANGYAIVLEGPVCAEQKKIDLLIVFEAYCKQTGLRTAFYRVDEEGLYHFASGTKRRLLIGQEAVMDTSRFSLEGKDKKSLRNGLNSLSKKGYKVNLYTAPLPGYLIQALEQVSSEWLKHNKMEEVIFSTGMFNIDEIKTHDVIAVMNPEEKIVSFLNIIPDYAPNECTYDLIRKTADAPGGCMDAMIIELVNYAKNKGLTYINLGLVPMSGIERPSNTAEQLVKFAYEKIKRFRQYKGLRNFKEKYATEWNNKYLLYENDFDLVRLPSALNKVMEP